jgi:5-methylcytosine-specific restriction endonuclease McrA
MPREYIPVEVDRRVRAAARHRCGYCLSPQHLVMARLEIEHITPVSRGGSSDESNLWLSCPLCNGAKGDRTTGTDPETGQIVPLFNPRAQR